MTPVISLTYNSHGGNGMLGTGFSLKGLTAITRAPQNKLLNGNIHGVNFDKDDKFVLDGQQLAAIKGAYGADQTEYKTYSELMLALSLMANQAVALHHLKFLLKGARGQVAEYGFTADSQARANSVNNATGVTTETPTVAAWQLDKITDAAGNYLTVHYQTDNTNGESCPTEIDYTGNDAASLKPYNKIVFQLTFLPGV